LIVNLILYSLMVVISSFNLAEIGLEEESHGITHLLFLPEKGQVLGRLLEFFQCNVKYHSCNEAAIERALACIERMRTEFWRAIV